MEISKSGMQTEKKRKIKHTNGIEKKILKKNSLLLTMKLKMQRTKNILLKIELAFDLFKFLSFIFFVFVSMRTTNGKIINPYVCACDVTIDFFVDFTFFFV